MGVPGVRRQACAEGEGGASHREPVDEGLGGQGLRAVGQGRPAAGKGKYFGLVLLWLSYLRCRWKTTVSCNAVIFFSHTPTVPHAEFYRCSGVIGSRGSLRAISVRVGSLETGFLFLFSPCPLCLLLYAVSSLCLLSPNRHRERVQACNEPRATRCLCSQAAAGGRTRIHEGRLDALGLKVWEE